MGTAPSLPDEIEGEIIHFSPYDKNDCRRIVISIMYRPSSKLIYIKTMFPYVRGRLKIENRNLNIVYSNICKAIQRALHEKLTGIFTEGEYNEYFGGSDGPMTLKNSRNNPPNYLVVRQCSWRTTQENMRGHFVSKYERRSYFDAIPVLVDIVKEALMNWNQRTRNKVMMELDESYRQYAIRIERRVRAKGGKSGRILTYRICKPIPESSVYASGYLRKTTRIKL